MAIVPLAGRVRAGTGKGPARQARLPAKSRRDLRRRRNPGALAVPKKEFGSRSRRHAGGNVIVALKLDGGAEKTAIIREVQRDPISHASSISISTTSRSPRR
jgi:ribosomal protein L25 (general stress protein Ctc)